MTFIFKSNEGKEHKEMRWKNTQPAAVAKVYHKRALRIHIFYAIELPS